MFWTRPLRDRPGNREEGGKNPLCPLSLVALTRGWLSVVIGGFIVFMSSCVSLDRRIGHQGVALKHVGSNSAIRGQIKQFL